jgi:hypothetical protein
VVPQVTRGQSSIYTILELTRELRQSEILTNLVEYSFELDEGSTIAVATTTHDFAIILTQDCDLLWDYEAAKKGEPPELNGVLMYELEPADQARAKIKGKDIWKRMRQNRDERYHFLEAVPAALDACSQGLPDMILDFKRCFTLPAPEIYRQLGLKDGVKRRCRLETPYREHLQSRAAYYLQRVMLPLPHQPSADI